ncbi:PREDICTED: homogentisate phytyltransferase 1, chloroplastic isoform X2 [Tarenaya hassleriana]|uniref:homogentisate phytyltransferase 1, chloroplastic isoform X2 n=1 Tax=Tarenaya hassleriana TaxID=28532 RepID=UPI00053C1EB7|nr:PREDICTED: homogentisate phytyltransferase 1, chloroplastic isoform X2 [Tarenaya hassleriana]XP_010548614.1 PREDICTED: homogentisate phytyltransferase 1, chloroplastic isoform X2 [Tarenaya hassleriana]XP_010548615.1 PREDICTED: homogentisate phytyltransferase 1, chloroplastic isoform X2 [Tarenaya hassleriana]
MESLFSGSSLVSAGGFRLTKKNLKVHPLSGIRVLRCRSCDILVRPRFRDNLVRCNGKRFSPVLCLKNKKRFLVHATEGQPEAYDPKNLRESVRNSLDAFYRFSRPHTVIGTVLSILSVSFLAVEKLSDISPLFFTGVLEAVVAALMMNIYIVGLNQLYDVDIDKVNKPYLPLASGEYSIKTGIAIVASFSVMSFWLGWIVGSLPLFLALSVSFLLGTAYSINVPLLRWKRFALVAAMCILAVRAVIVQIAFYLHIQCHVFGRPALFTRPLIFATAFMSFFSVVIALFKDIPDIEGDKIFGIRSFSVTLGQKRVFWICVSLLQMAYAVAILVGATSPFLWSKVISVLGHVILAVILWARAKSVDLSSKAAITSCYMFIWKLFYAEYLLIPFVK